MAAHIGLFVCARAGRSVKPLALLIFRAAAIYYFIVHAGLISRQPFINGPFRRCRVFGPPGSAIIANSWVVRAVAGLKAFSSALAALRGLPRAWPTHAGPGLRCTSRAIAGRRRRAPQSAAATGPVQRRSGAAQQRQRSRAFARLTPPRINSTVAGLPAYSAPLAQFGLPRSRFRRWIALIQATILIRLHSARRAALAAVRSLPGFAIASGLINTQVSPGQLLQHIPAGPIGFIQAGAGFAGTGLRRLPLAGTGLRANTRRRSRHSLQAAFAFTPPLPGHS